MVDVVYSSDDITVVGGPSSVNVNVSSGTRGVRGSRIYSVPGDPRLLTDQELPSDLLEYDLAIVVDSDSNEAFSIYQKVGSSPQDWEPLPPLSLNVFSTRVDIAFDGTGVAYAAIPVSLVFDLESYDVSQFAVQYQLENRTGTNNLYPMTSAISLDVQVGEYEGLPVQNLVAAFTAAEFNGTSWTPLVSTTRTLHAFITVI